jgi:hypothetical protein
LSSFALGNVEPVRAIRCALDSVTTYHAQIRDVGESVLIRRRFLLAYCDASGFKDVTYE